MLKNKSQIILIFFFFLVSVQGQASAGGVGVGNGKIISSYGFEIDYSHSLSVTVNSNEDFVIDNSHLVTAPDPLSSLEFLVLPGSYASIQDLQASIQSQQAGVEFLPIQFSTGPGFYHLDRSPGHVAGQYYLIVANNRAVEAKLDAYASGQGLNLVGSIMGSVSSPTGEPVAIEPIFNPEPSQFVVGAVYEWRLTDVYPDETDVIYKKLKILAINGDLITVDWSTSDILGDFNLGHTVGQFDSQTGLAIAVTDIDASGNQTPNTTLTRLPMFNYEPNLPGLIQHSTVHVPVGDINVYMIGDSSTNYPTGLSFWTGENAGPFRGCLIYEYDPSNEGPSFGDLTELLDYTP